MPGWEQWKAFYKHLAVKRIRFFIFIVLNFASVASDWLVYHGFAGVDEGLVFGPPRKAFVNGLLVVSVFVTMATIPEVYFDWLEIMKQEKHEGFRAGIYIFVDTPLMVMNMLIAACREEKEISCVHIWKTIFFIGASEEDISCSQIRKALFIIVVAFIRAIHSWIKVCLKKKEGEKKLLLKIKAIVVHLHLLFAISLAVVTQLNPNGYEIVKTKVPHNILKGEYMYDDRKYFTNVSIYFSHPYLEYETNYSRDSINFIRLLSIYGVQNSENDTTVNIKYDITHTNFLIQTDGKFEQCFTKMDGTLTKQAVCADQLLTPAGQFAFTFHYIGHWFPNLIFGDIKYNMRTGNNTNCEAPDFQVVDNIDAHIADPSSAMMRYFRTKPNITEEYHIIQMSNETYEFYRERDLINIEDIWVTYGVCKSIGSVAPHMDDQLAVLCQL